METEMSGRSAAVTSVGVDTHCPYCALQCGMEVGAGTVSARDFPVNRGGLCHKGWTAAALLDSPQRLTTPLLRERRDKPLRPVSWHEALDFVDVLLRSLHESYVPDSERVFGGGGLTH